MIEYNCSCSEGVGDVLAQVSIMDGGKCQKYVSHGIYQTFQRAFMVFGCDSEFEMRSTLLQACFDRSLKRLRQQAEASGWDIAVCLNYLVIAATK